MPGEATHCWVVVLDIENFSSRTDPIQRSLRTGMYEVLREALVRAGLPAGDIDIEDRGDGVLMIVPATVSPIDLAGPFVRALDDELKQKAVVYSPAHAMRFRVALHQGLAARDGEGWSGHAVNTACRLVDAGPLRDVLAAATSSRMVFVVSDEIYRAVVRHGHRSIDPAAYLPMSFRTKHGEIIESWVTVPGAPAPPGLPEEAGGPEAGGPQAAPGGQGGAAAGPGDRRPPNGAGISVGTVHGDVFQGNKTVNVHTNGPVRP
ncbi:hypothetical protein H4W23_18860 [Streptomyces gardneri]|uniref:hypothetical protein n=1 Tax=Streptomyces gardneri TaxID=66892 RepID=UPI0006E264BA|nr:hypothetical protein [Streptomyces gardneri]QPK46485.1 hypothetical protein H4W23_18860 [Streptomyces gardneri]WRK37873.1 hypothetical protein U0M97_18955 [Streptomyces venezuelae]